MSDLSSISQAIAIAVGSSGMLVGAVLFVLAAEVLSAVVRSRACHPSARWSDVMLQAAIDEAQAVQPLTGSRTRTLTKSFTSEPDARGMTTVALLTALVVGISGAIFLFGSGHVPQNPIVIAAILSALIGAVVLVAHRVVTNRGKRWRFKDFRRAATLGTFTEVSTASALVVSLAVVAHTGGLNALSFVEAGAIAVCTSLAIRLGPLPRGIITADFVFLVPLTWIGVPLPIAIAAVIVWRAGTLLTMVVALAVTRVTSLPARHRRSRRDGARFVHRAFFAVLSALPYRIQRSVRPQLFDAVFVRSNDPWNYGTSPYEARKRERLLASCNAGVTCVLEVGCANGHNLVALAEQFPGALIIGTEVSSSALALAQKRTQDLENVRVFDANDFAARMCDLGVGVDCIVLSEVLYYLGSTHAMRSALDAVLDVARPGCQVIMIHGSADARALHERALDALGLVDARNTVVDDPDGAFLVTVARVWPRVESDSSFESVCASDRSATTAPSQVLIRPARPMDAGFMAELHVQEFPHSLYAKMGARFLAALYRQWVRASGSFSSIAEINGVPVGFAVGKHASYQPMVRHVLSSISAGLTSLATRPTLWRRAVRIHARRMYRRLRRVPASRHSELTYIAVSSKHRLLGIGSSLLESFEWSAYEAGMGSCTLVTEADNSIGRLFYAQRGWHETAVTQSPDGRPLVRLGKATGAQ